jgi:hypothetical protein
MGRLARDLTEPSHVMDTRSSLAVVGGHGSEPFRQSCREVFYKALSLQRPRLVLVLGRPTIRFLGEAFPDRLGGWERLTGKKTFDLVDRQVPGGPIRIGLPLPNTSESFSVAALMHPSYRRKPSNAAKRRYRGWIGMDGERAMVADARGEIVRAESILAAMDPSHTV